MDLGGQPTEHGEATHIPLCRSLLLAPVSLLIVVARWPNKDIDSRQGSCHWMCVCVCVEDGKLLCSLISRKI